MVPLGMCSRVLRGGDLFPCCVDIHGVASTHVETVALLSRAYEETGEICVSTHGMMLGYYHKEEASEEVVFEHEGVKWLRTGDLGATHSDGSFDIVGRIKRILWAKGADGIVYRIYPMKIEEVIMKHPFVDKCAVVGRKNKDNGFLPVAFVMLNQDCNEEAVFAEIKGLCVNGLGSLHPVPELHTIDYIPTTRAGKIDFGQLEKLVN